MGSKGVPRYSVRMQRVADPRRTSRAIQVPKPSEEVVSREETRLLKAYEMVGAHYRQDMQMFWVRGTTFLLVELALLAIVSNAAQKGTHVAPGVSVIGIGVSLVWFLVARSSAAWIDAWRRTMIDIDSEVNPLKSYSVDRQQPGRKRKISTIVARPSEIGQLLPVVFIAGWTIIVLS